MVEVVPAILVETEEEFLGRIKLVAPYVSHVQWDIMDGKFVDNVTFSDPSALDDLTSQLETSNSQLAVEADLMVSAPENWVERFSHPGIDRLIFHVESVPDLEPLLEEARGFGFNLGIAAEPETPIEKVIKILPKVDRFQAMGGKSGFGGQHFNPEVLENIRKVRDAFPNIRISVDIGVNLQTVPQMVAAGADILVVGSAIFDSPSVEEAISRLRESASKGLRTVL